MGYEKEIEFIPWIHSAQFKAHSQALDYLKTLKKGTAIGVEFSPLVIEYLDRFTNRITHKKTNKISESETIRTMEKHDLLHPNDFGYTTGQIEVLQILSICRQRGLNIIPLDTNQYQIKVVNLDKKIFSAIEKKDFYLAKRLEEEKNQVILAKSRNIAISQNILNKLVTTDKIIVLFGVMHTNELMELTSKLFTKKFNNKYKLKEHCNTNIFGADKLKMDYIVKHIMDNGLYQPSSASYTLRNELEKTSADKNRLIKNNLEKENNISIVAGNRELFNRFKQILKNSNLSPENKKQELKALKKEYLKTSNNLYKKKIDVKQARQRIERLRPKLK